MDKLEIKKKIKYIYSYLDFEALVWLTGLTFLAFSNPYSETHHTFVLPTILFDIQGPGYNLGHSISHFFHGDIIYSLNTHPLGIITIFILLVRSYKLLKYH